MGGRWFVKVVATSFMKKWYLLCCTFSWKQRGWKGFGNEDKKRDGIKIVQN
jgi:hypothetical protein